MTRATRMLERDPDLQRDPRLEDVHLTGTGVLRQKNAEQIPDDEPDATADRAAGPERLGSLAEGLADEEPDADAGAESDGAEEHGAVEAVRIEDAEATAHGGTDEERHGTPPEDVSLVMDVAAKPGFEHHDGHGEVAASDHAADHADRCRQDPRWRRRLLSCDLGHSQNQDGSTADGDLSEAHARRRVQLSCTVPRPADRTPERPSAGTISTRPARGTPGKRWPLVCTIGDAWS